MTTSSARRCPVPGASIDLRLALSDLDRPATARLDLHVLACRLVLRRPQRESLIALLARVSGTARRPAHPSGAHLSGDARRRDRPPSCTPTRGTAAVGVVGVLVGVLLFPVGPVTLLSGTTVPLLDRVGRLALVALYLALRMAALGAVGLFVSTLTEYPVAAMATTAVLAVTRQVLGAIPQLEVIRPYLLSRHWLAYGDLLREPITFDGPLAGLGSAVAYTGVFLALAGARFAGKDVSSQRAPVSHPER
ncbi:MAG: hypothetical protein M3P48_09460 [Actinomycetota bacterium]|nr:hypothetical protein [Actinomycetota bacterium]